MQSRKQQQMTQPQSPFTTCQETAKVDVNIIINNINGPLQQNLDNSSSQLRNHMEDSVTIKHISQEATPTTQYTSVIKALPDVPSNHRITKILPENYSSEASFTEWLSSDALSQSSKPPSSLNLSTSRGSTNNGTSREDKSHINTIHMVPIEDLFQHYKLTKRANRQSKGLQLNLNIVTNNINGLQVKGSPQRLDLIIQKMYSENIDILLLQEINTNLLHPTVKQLFQQLRKRYPQLQCIWSQIPNTTHQIYQPGGTGIIVRPPISKHISQRHVDAMGRWAGITLKMRTNNVISIISTYQPPKGQSTEGTINVTSQQARQLADKGSGFNLFQQYRQDIGTLITRLQQQNHEIILGGDFNERNEKSNVIEDIIRKYQLVDIMILKNSKPQPTYLRGPNVLDRIFVSPTLITSSTSVILGDQDSIVNTDHLPIHLQIAKHITSHSEHRSRHLVSNHTHKVSEYIQYVYKHMTRTKLFQVIDSLQPETVTADDLNRIDKLLLSIRLRAEARLKRQNLDWWHKDIPQWKKQLQQCNNAIKELRKSEQTSQREIIQALTAKYKIVQKFRDHTTLGFQIRHKLIQQEISALKTQQPKNTKKINHLKHLLRTEKTRELYRKIREKTTTDTQQVPYLQIPSGNHKYTTIRDLDQIASHISEHNHVHFAQAHTTPLSNYKYISSKARHSISPEDNIKWSEEQVQKNAHLYQNTSSILNPLIQTFVHQITTPPMEITDNIITQEDWRKKIQRWKERTTTSPSGLHLGHHKALISPHKFSFDDNSSEQLEMNQQQSDILNAYLKFLNVVLKSATSLERWKTVHSVALFKDQDNHYVHRIRNIHIYEADYNLVLKLKWEQAMSLAEKYQMVHPSQHGSRKNRRSINPITFEIMQQEISRQANVPYTQINYDAQACYDQIIPDIAFTISKKYGVHPNILHLVRETMSQSKFFIKLGPKVTPAYYSSKNHDRLFGTGQGSGCSPHIWTMLSSELLHLYSVDSKGFHLSDPYGYHNDSLHSTAYVDDINTHHSFSVKDTVNTMLMLSRTSAQKWSDILYISGGKLSPTKCNFYAVQWQHATTGRTTIQPCKYPPITLGDREGKPIILNNVQTHLHHKSLGYYQSASKPRNFQKIVLTTKYNQMVHTINAAGMDFKEVQTYYHTIHSPRIQYIAQMSSIQNNETKEIIRKGTELALQRMGYSSKTPHGLVYGHMDYGGLDMIDVYILQGAQNLINFTRSMSSGHATHSAMKIAYLWWRFSDGRGQCPLQHFSATTTITDSIWFTELMQFIHKKALRVNMDNMMYPLLRQNDKYIMDLVHQQGYTNKIVSNINQCRLFLHALTLSDIVTADGKYIETESYRHGTARPMTTRRNLLSHTSKPNKSVWFYWQSFIHHITTYKSKRLLIPLGEWIVSSSDIRRSYQTYRDHEYLYVRSSGHFKKVHIQQKTTTYLQKLLEEVIPCIQSISGIIPREYTRTSIPSKSKTHRNDNNSLQLPDEIIIVTDASIHNEKAAIAWIVTTETGKVIKTSQHSLEESHISSFRAEALGVFSALNSLHLHIQRQDGHYIAIIRLLSIA